MADALSPLMAARWPPALLAALTWAALLGLDGRLDLANLALLHVAGLVLAALWGPAPVVMAGALLSVLAFNVAFVPPRGALQVDLAQHAVLLGGMLVTAWTTAALAAGHRRASARAREQAARAEALRALGERLRDAPDPAAEAPALVAALAPLARGPVRLMLLDGERPARDDDAAAAWHGGPDAEQRAGLWLVLRSGRAFGPGTGRHDHLPAWGLPLPAGARTLGAAWVPVDGADPDRQAQAQALCDLVGQALLRAQDAAQARAAQARAEAQALRHTLLAAIAHDFRTPLAAMLSAATSLRDQAERLAPAQRTRLAGELADEAARLGRIAEHTLQIARLDASGVALRRDWESPEEIVGSVLAGQRRRHPQAPLTARVEPGLPLLRLDAALVAQALDNLLENALTHGAGGPVELLARREGTQLLLAVRDRGAGVPPGERARLFAPYERGDRAAGRGVGLGLALAQAVARAHGGTLVLRPRGHGGSAFELRLPLEPAP